jgi:hypothetical protein
VYCSWKKGGRIDPSEESNAAVTAESRMAHGSAKSVSEKYAREIANPMLALPVSNRHCANRNAISSNTATYKH